MRKAPLSMALALLLMAGSAAGEQPSPGVEMNGSWHEATATRERFCLNGEWDFHPLGGTAGDDWKAPAAIGEVNGYDWKIKARVPGTWKGGLWHHEQQFFDAATKAQLAGCLRAWYRRSFFVPAEWAGRIVQLQFDGVGYKAAVYVNRQPVGTHLGGVTPFEVDITGQMKPGQVNELLVYNTSWKHGWDSPPEYPLAPGNKYGGIWGDVYLRATGEIFTDNVFVKTSVRKGTLTCVLEIVNKGPRTQKVTVGGVVMDAETGDAVRLTLPDREVTVPAGDTVRLQLQKRWPKPRYWSVDDPHLYFLHTRVSRGGEPIDEEVTRFGFREFWIDGKDFRLNGEIVRLRNFPYLGEGLAQMRPEYVRGWFTLMKEKLHHNSVRFFNPLPDVCARIADEVGLLVSAGTSLVGGQQGQWNVPEANATRSREIGELIRARRNHPSIVIWDAENECWSMVDIKKYRDGNPETVGVYNWLLGLRGWIAEHDDTRPISFHNLGDMFDWTKPYMEEFFEAGDLMGKADHYNLHYPRNYRHTAEQAEVGAYWAANKNKPLIVGEFSGTQTTIPGNTSIFIINGEAFTTGGVAQGKASYYFFRRVAGAWRASGMSGIYAWYPNIYSTKQMLRPHRFQWDDLTTPGPKPASVPYAWYNPGWDKTLPVYVPDYTFPQANFRFWELVADTYAPLLINLGGDYWDHNYLSGQRITRQAHIVNDTSADQDVTWSWTLKDDGKRLTGGTETLKLARAQIEEVTFDLQLPQVQRRTELSLDLTVKAGRFASSDGLELSVYPARSIAPPTFPAARVALYDKVGKTADVLTKAGIRYRRITDIPAKLKPGTHKVFIIGCDSADSYLTRTVMDVVPVNVMDRIREVVRHGGTVVVFEQDRDPYRNLNGIFPGIVTPPIEHASVPYAPHSYADVIAPGHPIFTGLKRGLLLWNGEYGRICEFAYPRPFGTSARPLLLSGRWGTSLVEGTLGKGRYLLCQANLTTRYGKDPEATRLMHNLLSYALAPPPVVAAKAASVGDLGGLLGTFTPRTLARGFAADDITGKLAETELTPYGVVILGRDTLTAGSEVTGGSEKLLKFVAGGGTLLVLAQNPATFKADWLGGDLHLRPMESQYIHKERTLSPLIWGMSAFDLTRYYIYIGSFPFMNEWSRPKVAAEFHDWGADWTSLLLVSKKPDNWNLGSDKPVGGIFPTGGSALLTADRGKGRIVLCQLDLDQNCAALPAEAFEDLDWPALGPRRVADVLLTNLGLTSP